MSWAFFSPSMNGSGGLVTALPSNPSNGDQVVFTDSLTAPTYFWLLKYVAAATGSYKWYFVGGSPARAQVLTAEATSTTSYTDLATVGPDFTTPLAGDYDILHGAEGSTSGLNGGYASYALGGTAASDNDAVYNGPYLASGAQQRRQTGLAASTLIRMKYKAGGANNTTFARRWINVVPFRVG